MARAGVRPDISERVLGHTIRGVEGVYDQHDYSGEKADALARPASTRPVVFDFSIRRQDVLAKKP
jgi:hypothetical protein